MEKLMSMIRSKTDAVKARLMLTTLTLLSTNNNKFSVLRGISHKFRDAIDGIVSKRHKPRINNDDDDDDDHKHINLALVLYQQHVSPLVLDNDDYNYPDLRHTLFDEEDEQELEDLLASGEDPNASESAIEVVKNSKENFNLEDDIDQVADLFITKFHKRMRLQKLLSFKRHQQQMLDTSCC